MKVVCVQKYALHTYKLIKLKEDFTFLFIRENLF